MTARNRNFLTVDDEWLASYAAGGLTSFKRLAIDCQAAIEPGLEPRLAAFDAIGGAFLEASQGEALSGDFMERMFGALGAQETARVEEPDDAAKSDDWMPAPLRRFLASSDITLNWRKAGPGIERAALCEEGGERLYLLRAKPGLKLPVHTHRGEEWTLILQGGYHVGEEGYGAGDLHREDESCLHQPVIDDDGVCISLVVDEGKLKFRHPLLKLLQPLIGI
ncbi:MAG: ChrR family anti-sigma-E factor [Parvularculaceae bacterium]